MARATVTFEQVAAIANSIVAAGNHDPSARSIREALAKRVEPGTPVGSPNSIQRFLLQWRAQQRPVDPPLAQPQLPATLAADMHRALYAAAQSAREHCENRQVQLQGELEELARAGEDYESRIEQLNQQLEVRTKERDLFEGRFVEQAAGTERLLASLSRATDEATDLRLANVRLSAGMEALESRLSSEAQRLVEVKADCERLSARHSNEQACRSAAEQRAEVAEARFDATKQTLSASLADMAALQRRLLDLEQHALRAAAAEAALAELRLQLNAMQIQAAGVTAATEVLGDKESEGSVTPSFGKITAAVDANFATTVSLP